MSANTPCIEDVTPRVDWLCERQPTYMQVVELARQLERELGALKTACWAFLGRHGEHFDIDPAKDWEPIQRLLREHAPSGISRADEVVLPAADSEGGASNLSASFRQLRPQRRKRGPR